MSADDFDALVDEAWKNLPEAFKSQLRNVEIVIEDWPDAHTLHLARIRNPLSLLGFYHGVPLTERGLGYHMVTPDKISLYREPIMQSCPDREHLGEAIAHVLRHEIAHHFGISDARLHELGAY
ncbi:MAG TPA: metallopeptidase family protein [Anaerolineae bacterium]